MSFHDDHDELRGILTRFGAALSAGQGARGLLSERVRFAKLFAEHNRDELASMEALQLDRLSATDREAVEQCRSMMLTLRRDYSAHIYKWTPDAIDADWTGYSVAVRRLQQRLLDLLDFEEKHVLPLIEGPAAIRSAA